MSSSPPGWTTISLESVCDVIRGITFPASAKETHRNGTNVCCLRTSNIQNEINWDDVYFVPSTYVKRQEQLVEPGDILMSMANSYELVGKVAVATKVETKAAFGAFLAAIRPSNAIYGQYLFHLLRSSRVQAELRIGSTQTTNIANISVKTLAGIDVPIPPLNEQKRIADKLDRLLARVDAAKARLDKIPALLRRLRQSIIADAVSGALTEEWRDSHALTSEWRCAALKEVAVSRLGKMLDKEKNQGTPIPYLRNVNVRWFGFDLSDIQLIRVSPAEAVELVVRKGDLLVCEGGEPGRCAVWGGEDGAYVYQKALHRIRVGRELLPEWVCYQLKAAADSGALAESFTGTTIKHLTGVALSVFEVLVPRLDEQKEIVRRVEALFAIADRIEAHYHAARARVDRLTQSLLAKAFRGELVPQDPNDEPASVLLERIRAQRATASLQGRRKGKEDGEALALVAEPKTTYRRRRKRA